MFFAFSELLLLVLAGLIVLAIAGAANRQESGRHDPDPTGRRPYVMYLVGITFIALFVLLFSSTALVSQVATIALGADGPHSSAALTQGGTEIAQPPRPVPIEPFDGNQERIRGAILAGLIALVAGLVLLFHATRLRQLINEPGFAQGPARRAYQVYLYAVCFVSVLTVMIAAVIAAFGLVRIIAPGTTDIDLGHGFERDEGIKQFVIGAYLTIAASGLFVFHWRRTTPFRSPPPEEPRPEVAPPV